MKLNVTQAEILATEVQKQIETIALAKKDANLEKTIKTIIEARNKSAKKVVELREKLKELEEEHSKLIIKFNKDYDLNLNTSIYYSEDCNLNAEIIIKNKKLKNVPSVQQIKSKIIMKSLFGSEQEMQEFLQALVNEYTN